MEINKLIDNIKKKISLNIPVESVVIEDKTFLHKKHKGYQKGKFHIKILIESSELRKKSRINANKIIFSLLKNEIDKFLHSIQISII
jgi:BolA protein